MDDQNPFESKYGSGAAIPAPANSAASDGNENPFEATYGAINDKQQKDQQYAEKIQAYLPQQQEYYKNVGPGASSDSVPLLGPLMMSGARHVEAALGAGSTDPTGKKAADYSERLQNLAARDEAAKIARKEAYPIQSTIEDFVPSLLFGAVAPEIIGLEGAAGVAGEAALPGIISETAAPAAEGAAAATAVKEPIIPETSWLKTTVPGRAVMDIGRLGAEGAAYSAASATGEKYFGTSPDAEDTNITQSALLGFALGSGLGTAAKAIGAGASFAAEKLPDWMTNMFSKDKDVLNTLAQKYELDRQTGFVRNAGTKEESKGMSFDDYHQARANGQTPIVADVGGDNLQNYIADVLSNGDPDQVNALKGFLQRRSNTSGINFSNFLEKMYGVTDDMNLSALRQAAEDERIRVNQENYGVFRNDPEHGRGTWSPEWNQYLNNGLFKEAINAVDNERRLIDPNYRSPFRTMFMDPSGKKMVNDVSLENMGLTDEQQLALMKRNIFSASDLSKMSPEEVSNIFFQPPVDATNPIQIRVAKDNANQAASEILNAQKKFSPRTIVDSNQINTKYLDDLQRKLNEIGEMRYQNGQVDVANAQKGIANKIVGDLTDSKSRYFNPAFAKAREGYLYRKNGENAFKYGESFLTNINNTKKIHDAVEFTKTMTPEEKISFQRAVLLDMLNRVKSGDKLNADKAMKFFKNAQYRKGMENIFGKDDVANMEHFINMEKLMNDVKNHLGMVDPNAERGPASKMADWVIAAHSLDMLLMKKGIEKGEAFLQSRYARKLYSQIKSDNINDLQEAHKALTNSGNSQKESAFIAKNILMGLAKAGTRIGATAMGRKEGGRVGYDEGGDVRAGDSVGGYGGDTGGSSGYNGGGNNNNDQSNDNVRADSVSQSQQASSDSQRESYNRSNNQDVSNFAFGNNYNVSGNVGAAPSQGNPESVATPHLDYVNKIVDSFQGPESSYGQNTYNMSSGAFGPWGLMPNTAIDQLKQVHPEMINQATGQFNPADVAGGGLNTSQDPQMIGNNDLLRNIVINQGLQRELVTNLTNQNMQTLASNGFDTTPGNVYAAHMLGVNDAMKLLSSDPNAAIESTGVNPKAIKSNKLNGMTVEDYLNHTNNVMAKAPTPPPAPTAGRTFQKKGGRVQRSTGGRIPEVDKIFKEAKRNLDGHTKSMLNVHDDAIVNALRIAQGRI